MPTLEKDAETNACFKQVLLRPHKCNSSQDCRGVKFTRSFCVQLCAAQKKVGEASAFSYEPNWRHYIAEQQVLAERADEKLRRARMLPVLQDINVLRQWWVSGAERYGCIQEEFLPLFCGLLKHSTDSTLAGTWARRQTSCETPSSNDSAATKKHMRLDRLSKPDCDRRLWKIALPVDVVWATLRFAGVMQRHDGVCRYP